MLIMLHHHISATEV